MKRRFSTFLAALALLAFMTPTMVGWGQTTYEQLTSIANIDESAQYVLGIDGTGFHYEGTSSWGKTDLPSAHTPIYYTLTKASDGNSFTAQATISGTTYYLQIPTSNTFSMATSTGTNTAIIIGTTQVSGTNYAVANKNTTTRHLRINGTSGLRSYAGTTGSMAFFYKVVSSSSTTYTVTYDANGGTGTMTDSNSPYNAGATVTVLDNEFTRTDYTFDHWNTAANDSGISYDEGDDFTINANTTLYAQWTANSGGSTAKATLTKSNLGLSGTSYSSGTKTIDNIGYSYTDLMPSSDNIQAKASTGTIINSTPYPGDIISVAITHSGTARATTINGSANGTDWTQVATGSGSITADFSGKGYKYFQITRGSNAAYWTKVEITYSTSSSSQSQSDLAITNASTALSFDLYSSATAQVISYTTSSTGAITITPASPTSYFSYVHDATAKTITVTPLAVTPSAQTVTISQAADEDYYNGTATFTVSVINSNAPGTQNNPYSVAQAIANTPSSGNVYIRGIVSSFYNTSIVGDGTNYRYYISDDGNTTTQLLVYKGKGLNQATFTNADDLLVGDEVVIYGSLITYSNAPEVASGNYIVSLVRKPAITTDAANNSLAIPDQILGSYDETGFATLKVSGTNLTAGITLALGASSAFEMSTDLDNWFSTITIPQSNGSITDEEVVIRLKETLSVVQQYTDNITLTSTGADNVVVAISGRLTNQTYTIEQYSTPATANGTITFAYDGPLYEGTTVTMTATPADGYEFTANSWEFYDADEDEEVTLTVTDGNKITMPAYNLAVDATFAEKDKYAITSVVTPANSGTIVTDNEAWEGKVVEVEVEAEDGYAFSSIVVCKTGDTNTTINVSGDVTNGFTFTMPAYAVTVTATFVVNLDVTYDFSTADNFYTTAGGSTHPETGSSHNVSEFYYGNGDKFTASGTSHYFGQDNNHYFLFGKQDALVNLPTIAGYKVTQIIIHSSTGHSTNVNVAIVSGEDIVAVGQIWSTKDHDYTYDIPAQYQTSALSVKVTNGYNAQFTSITLVREYRTYTLTIDGYADADDKDGYRLIASPVTVDPSTVGMTTGDFDLYYFDESNDGQEWRNYEDENVEQFNLVPGTGYLYAKEGAEETFNFTLTGVPYSGDGIIPLHNTPGTQFEGWNLVGNPWGVEAVISMAYYEMNEDGTELTAGEDDVIDAMQGVFVQYTEDDQEVLFLPVETGTASSGESKLALNLTKGRGVIDRAIVRFGEGGQLSKFQINPNNTKLYITEGNKDYAVVRSANQGEMPVSFKAAENGNYTISVETRNVETSYLHLIDNMTGVDVDLLATPSYSFEARTTDYTNRFRLVFNANGVEENNATANFAYFNGSSWTVSNMGEATLQVVDMMGRIVSTQAISGNTEVSINQVPGVYMLRLVNGENVMVQKVVVR